MKKIQRSRLYVPFALLGLIVVFVAFGLQMQSSSTQAVSTEEVPSTTTMMVSQPPAPTSSEQMLFRERGLSESAPVATSTPAAPKPATASKSYPCVGERATDFRCIEDYYGQIIKTKGGAKGIPAAFADLKDRSAHDSYVLAECHPLTHSIGRFAAELFSDVASAYAYGDGLCWSGYYHGVLETFVYRSGITNIDTSINGICASLNADRTYSFNYFNCVHGLGHGLMALEENQIPASLKHCDALTGDWEQQSCAGGVYMENVIADGLNHVTGWLDPQRPLFPCDVAPEKYKNTCYLMQTSFMLKINGGDFKKTFEWCRDAGAYQTSCLQSLGRDASGRSSSDLQRTHDTCVLGSTTEEVSNCVIGAVKDFISYFHSDVQGKALCNSFDDPVRKLCLDTATAYYTGF